MTRREPPANEPGNPTRTARAGMEDVAIARKILVANAATVAFVPVASALDTWPVLVRLARAVYTVSNAPLGLIRSPRPVERGARERPVDEGAFDVREVPGEAALSEVVPAPVRSFHEAAANLAPVVSRVRPRFGHLLVDLSGFLPDAREVLEVPDAFVSAAFAGRTREEELRALVELLPTSRHLGTLLLDHV